MPTNYCSRVSVDMSPCSNELQCADVSTSSRTLNCQYNKCTFECGTLPTVENRKYSVRSDLVLVLLNRRKTASSNHGYR